MIKTVVETAMTVETEETGVPAKTVMLMKTAETGVRMKTGETVDIAVLIETVET